MNSTLTVRGAFVLFVAAGLTITLFAQEPHPGDVNAALRAHDQMVKMHHKSGSFPGGYRPLTAYTYSQSAALHAETLNSYQDVEELPAATAQEHLTEITRNVDAASKELKKLDSETAKNSPAVQHLSKAIQSHYDTAQKSAKAAQEEIKKTGTANIAGSPHYSTMSYELNAAAAAHRQMLKTLGIGAHGTRN